MTEKELTEIRELIDKVINQQQTQISTINARLDEIEKKLVKTEIIPVNPQVETPREIKLPPQAKKVQLIIKTDTNEWVLNLLV